MVCLPQGAGGHGMTATKQVPQGKAKAARARNPLTGMTRTYDVDALRKDFPILATKVHGKPLVYLDNAATTQKPQAVIDAVTHYYERDNANVHRGVHLLSERATKAYEDARQKAARFIGAATP